MKIFEAPSIKIFTHGAGSPLSEQVGEWGLPVFLLCCSILPTEVLIIVGVSLALLKLMGQISQTQKKTPSKLMPALPPGLSPPELCRHSPSKRPLRPQQTRTQIAPRASRSQPVLDPPEPIKIVLPGKVESEACMLAALEAYEAVSGTPPLNLHKKKLPPVPDPSTSLKCLSSNLLGNASPPSGCLANRVDDVLLASLPQIRIYHFARTSGTNGHSIPYLHVVIFMQSNVASTSCLQERLQRCTHRTKDCTEQFSGEKLQKCVLRHCLNSLVDQGFKYRRSAFNAESPTVLMLAPAEFTDGTGNVGVEISVNNPLPLLNAALVYEASNIDQRASDFISSVQRWADARALAHVGHGPLNMYAWAHVAIFYLQTRASYPMPLLRGEPHLPTPSSDPSPEQAPPLDAALFQGFFEFLSEESLWNSGSIFVRGSPPPSNEVFISDAFRPNVDLGLQVRTKKHAIARIRNDALSALKHFSTSGTVADLLAQPDSEAVATFGLNAGWARVGVGETSPSSS